MAEMATTPKADSKGKAGRKTTTDKLKAAEDRIAELEAKINALASQPQRGRGRAKSNPLDDQPLDSHGFATTFLPDRDDSGEIAYEVRGPREYVNFMTVVPLEDGSFHGTKPDAVFRNTMKNINGIQSFRFNGKTKKWYGLRENFEALAKSLENGEWDRLCNAEYTRLMNQHGEPTTEHGKALAKQYSA